MYISQLKLWDFRKYGTNDSNFTRDADLVVPFAEGLNLLIGENDSGKTAILDAIKLVLKTHAYEWIKVDDSDFFTGSEKLRIELEFSGIKDNEAKHFIEWLGWKEITDEDDKGKSSKKNVPVLILIYQVEKVGNRIVPSDIKAGMDGIGHPLNAEAREYLKCTYLKALRDANSELTAGKSSRLSQILQEHKLFKEKGDEVKNIFITANKEIKDFFNDESKENSEKPSNKEQIIKPIDVFLEKFVDRKYASFFDLTSPEIKSILEKISLGILGQKNLGLGTMNRLFMAAELLHLKRDWDGLKLCMIEELEAHLHPQAQMKIIEALIEEAQNGVQFILTTHSPNIASKVDLKSLIICKDNEVFPMGEGNTKLENENYIYLKRFLDVTKSNLFFAKGVIIVEGWSEEILIPEIAKKIGFDLTKKEISIVNVASTAYLHFAKAFLRKDDKSMNVPVAVVTDLDNRPDDDGKFKNITELDEEVDKKIKTKYENLITLKKELNGSNVTLELAKEWTLEWCLYKSDTLSNLFKESVKKVHSGTDEFESFNSEFEAKFISKLKKEKGTSPIDKVKIASTLAEKIRDDKSIDFSIDDTYIKYIVDAIKHACSYDEN